MAAYPRCGARLRDGEPCGRTAAKGSEFCSYHSKLLETVDAETMRQGRTPKASKRQQPRLRVVAEPLLKTAATNLVASVDPSTVRPSLAAAAAENLEQLKTSLLEAAGSAVKPISILVECSSCGERSRIEAPVPDVRARVAAIELLLREGLGRPATAEDVRSTRVPATVAAVQAMSWDDMQALFVATYVDEIAAVQRSGGKALVREKLERLSEGERRVLSESLDELELVRSQ
jgi:hypothetical protein